VSEAKNPSAVMPGSFASLSMTFGQHDIRSDDKGGLS